MIEKLKLYRLAPSGYKHGEYTVQEKINELVDAVNELHKEAENNARIRADHEKFIATLFAENNMHEKQIDELQMKLEPEKCEPTENTLEDKGYIKLDNDSLQKFLKTIFSKVNT